MLVRFAFGDFRIAQGFDACLPFLRALRFQSRHVAGGIRQQRRGRRAPEHGDTQNCLGLAAFHSIPLSRYPAGAGYRLPGAFLKATSGRAVDLL